MRVHHCSILQIIDESAFGSKCSREFKFNACAMCPVPIKFLLSDDLRFIHLRPYHQVKQVGGVVCTGPRDDTCGNAGCQLSEEDCCGYSDTLLSPALAYLVKPGSIKEFSENIRDIVRDNTRSVILDCYSECLPCEFCDGYPDIRKYFSFFACVQGVVNRLFDGGDDAAGWRIKSQQMLIFFKEFCNTDTLLLFRQLFGYCHPWLTPCIASATLHSLWFPLFMFLRVTVPPAISRSPARTA